MFVLCMRMEATGVDVCTQCEVRNNWYWCLFVYSVRLKTAIMFLHLMLYCGH